MFTALSRSKKLKRTISAFSAMPPKVQAETILDLVRHWANTNQVVIFRTRRGLRDRARQIKSWLSHFIDLSRSVPSLRVIYLSERRLPDEIALGIGNLAQFHVTELSESDIQFLLSELIDDRFYDSSKAEALAHHIHGHPATAHYTAKLVNSEKNLDTLNANPDEIYAFQDRVLGRILSSDAVSDDQRKIIALLGIFPQLSFSILARVIEISRKQLSRELWELQESSLISASGPEYYTCPSVVASRSRKELFPVASHLLGEVRSLIESDIGDGKSEFATDRCVAHCQRGRVR